MRREEKIIDDMENNNLKNKDKIAIIGISCRFPEAENVDDFWKNLISKKESILHLQDAELETNTHLLNNKNFIKAGSFIDNVEYFDPDFFGIGTKEAEMMDPQQRIFMECCWEALESSGYARISQKQNIGVFSSCGINSYLINNVNQNVGYVKNRNFLSNSSDFQVMMGNDRDYLSTKVSYRFNLTGPSMDIQTACSSSLVAIHEACKAIRADECDMALVGSASIMTPQKAGYLHEEGMISSADGHCRPFDKNATGTVFGNGAASVLLKKLTDAERDGDIIHATIDGSAVNNDGKEKIGYSAPSINAQIDVIHKALADADLKPKDIDYIEAHGTGTKLGDPIEVKSIQRVFLNNKKKCGIGSVKGNIGHLGWASGMAGLIKAVLVLKHKTIPANINFESLNENITIDEKDSVYICDENINLSHDSPLHVGVSAFGLGGTNAHVVLGSYSKEEKSTSVVDDEVFLLKISAQTKKSLAQLLKKHAKYLSLLDNENLAHYCYTNNLFRGDYKYRDFVFGKNKKEILQKIKNIISESDKDHEPVAEDPSNGKIAFVFAGQGSQKHKNTLELYKKNRFFRKAIDECEVLYRKNANKSLKDILYGDDERIINDTKYTQPAIFAVEYALCKLWESFGVKPDYVLGHSLGEYVAAHIAKVLSLKEAFGLVIKRGELSASISSPGSMLVIFSDLDFVTEKIREYKNISIAAINSSYNIVVSGLREEIESLINDLERGKVEYKQLNISSAFHSPLVEQIIPEFRKYIEGLQFKTPVIPFVSNLTGKKDDGSVSDPDYWMKHIRNTVLFKDSLDFLKKEKVNLFIEISPKLTLSQIVLDTVSDAKVVSSLTNTDNSLDEFFESLGNTYKFGRNIDFSKWYEGSNLRKIFVPTYAFDRKRYWIDPSNNNVNEKEGDYFYDLLFEENTKFNNTGIKLLDNQDNLNKIDINDYLNFEVLKNYSQALEALEYKAVGYIYQFFLDLGCPINLKFNISELFNVYGVNLKYKNLINLFLNYLQDVKLARLEDAGVELYPKVDLKGGATMARSELVTDELNLVDLCGQNLKSIIVGNENATDVIFSEDTEETLGNFYKNSISLKLMNQLGATFINNIYKSIPSKDGLRILEIGAGTGSTLDYISHVFPQSKTQYLFTDLSNKFLNDAKGKFFDLPYVKYQKLDINDSFEKQGVSNESFDIIIANNTVHASKDVNFTLDNIKKSLSKKGKLIMIEGSRPVVWVDLIFGLFDGWWHFTDFRTDYPLLENKHWRRVLKQSGFVNVQCLSPEETLENKDIKMMPQSLIVADTLEDVEQDLENWLLMGDQELIRKFKSRCSFEGINIVEVFDKKDTAGSDHFVINYESEDDFDNFIKEHASINKVVYFSPSFSDSEKDIEYVSRQICLPLLNLSKSLQRMDVADIDIFSVIDYSNGGINGSIQGALYGMSKTIHAEAGFRARILEVDSLNSDHFKYVYEEIAYPENDDFVFRDDIRLSLRVIPKDPSDSKLSVYKNKGYVIAGAYGEIGLLVVEWLASRGAGNIILLGRNKPNPDVCRRIEKIKLQYGVEFFKHVVDISDEREIIRVFKEIKDGKVDIKGVINVAGVVDDSTILNQNWDKFNNVFRAKVYGNINLFNAVSENNLDFFVIFSSIVGIFGNGGQINHSAANSFLRYFSDFGKNKGVPMRCIHWGVWADIGTLSEKKDVLGALEKKGIYALGTDQIHRDLGKVLGYPNVNVIYSKINWDQFLQSNKINKPLLSRIITSGNVEIPSQTKKYISNNEDSYVDVVLHHLSDVLGVRVDEINMESNLFDLGMDSLTSIQLKNSLQEVFNCTLPSNFVYQNKTTKEILSYFKREPIVDVKEKSESSIDTREVCANISIQQKRWLSLSKKWYGRLLVPIIFSSSMDTDKFKKSLENVVDKNTILRTIFTSDFKKRVVSTRDFLQEDFESMFLDFSYYDSEQKSVEFQKVADNIRSNPPDPYLRPSWKITCVKDTKDSFVVLLFIQHLEFDGASVTQFVNELKKEYFNQERDGEGGGFSYDEYIKFQKSYIESGSIEKDKIFYKELYKNFEDTPLLSLDGDDIKTLSRPSRCISVSEIVSTGVLQKVSRISEVSVFAILSTAYAKLISDITGRKKNIIGTITNSRPDQFSKTIGPFVQPFPIPVNVSGEDIHTVRQIHDLILEINSRAAYPVVNLIDNISVFSGLEYDTYFSDTFIMLNNYRQEKNNHLTEVVESLGEIKRGYLSGINNYTLNEIAGLFLIIDFYEGGLRFNFWYHEDRFSKSQIRGWINKYKSILNEIISNMDN